MAPVLRIPDLKEIVSFCIAGALWKHVDFPVILWLEGYEENEDYPLIKHVLKSVKKLGLPQCIAELLKTHVRKMKTELDEWIRYLSNEILRCNGKKNELYCDIIDIIWYSDGTIDRKTTARSLLNSLRLSEIEKYHILCHYCLKDDIGRLSPLLFTKNIVDHVDFSSDALIYYWNCFFRQELHKVPIEGSLSLDVFMFRHEDLDGWFAKEYFFNRLNTEEQVQNVIWLIDEGDAYLYLKQLLMKLTEHQLLQVYMDRAERIIDVFMITDDCYEEILPTWYDVRDLITQDQFASVFTNLLDSSTHGGVPGAILTEIWTSAGRDFRSCILTDREHVFMEKTLYWFKRTKDDSFLSTLLQYLDANLKREIIIGPFFRKFCEDLISKLKLTKLERLFIVWSQSNDDLIQFKRDFTKTTFFVDVCESVVKGAKYGTEKDYLSKLQMLEHLWNIWFSNVEEVTRFKRDLTEKELFRDCCKKILLNEKLYTLESLLNLCLVDDGEFERDLAKNPYLYEYFEELMRSNRIVMLEQLLKACFGNIRVLTEFQNKLVKESFFKRRCEKAVENGHFLFLKLLFDCCLSNTEEATRFKRDLVTKLAPEYCGRFYLRRNSLRDLKQLLNLCLPETSESAQFMRDLVFNSNRLKHDCLHRFSWRESETNDLLTTLLLSQSNLVVEYKKHLWMSSSGIQQMMNLLSKEGEDVLNDIIADNFPDDTDSANEFKKKIIFSSKFTEELQQMILDGEALNKVKKRIEQFLPLNEDRRKLKKQLIDNLQPKIAEIFYKYGFSGWQSLIQWYLEDEEAVQELKWKLPMDEIFEHEFKECIFQTYDEHHRVSRCTLKKNFVFDSLDRVLNWYFESPKETKDYKVQKINAYENMKTINTLLKKNCHSSYKMKVMDWFFENDILEIAKFKKKHEGEQFVSMIRIHRESYFKNRRTL